jgi:hypothetical protein
MSIEDDPGVAARVDAIERRVDGLARRLGDRKRPRDGQRVLSVRAGDERIARVHEAARRRGCTLTTIMNEAIDHVIGPSTLPLSEPRQEQSKVFTPRTLPREAARQSLSNSLAEQARLATADAAVMADRRPRDGRMTETGMMTEPAGFGTRRR